MKFSGFSNFSTLSKVQVEVEKEEAKEDEPKQEEASTWDNHMVQLRNSFKIEIKVLKNISRLFFNFEKNW